MSQRDAWRRSLNPDVRACLCVGGNPCPCAKARQDGRAQIQLRCGLCGDSYLFLEMHDCKPRPNSEARILELEIEVAKLRLELEAPKK